MRRGGVEPGSIVSGTKILTTRLPTTGNVFGSISTFKICKNMPRSPNVTTCPHRGLFFRLAYSLARAIGEHEARIEDRAGMNHWQSETGNEKRTTLRKCCLISLRV